MSTNNGKAIGGITAAPGMYENAKSIAVTAVEGAKVACSHLTADQAHELGELLLVLAEEAGAEPKLGGFMGDDTHPDAKPASAAK
jgi:hypothetical protein